MSTSLGPHNVNEFLSAFADGELDAAQNLAVLDYIETHPEAFAYLRDRQRLRQSAQRVVLSNQHANTMPAALKARLSQVADSEGRASGDASRRRKWWQHLLGAVAVAAAVGMAAWHFGRLSTDRVAVWSSVVLPDDADGSDARDAALPDALVQAATLVHIDCSRLDERLHAGGYPDALGDLFDRVSADLGSPVAAPDLRGAGYYFVGAGPCLTPLDATVHLLYRSGAGPPRRAVSVFAQAYRGQFGLTRGRLYRIHNGTASRLFAWRTERAVYFLTADEDAVADRAVRLIPLTPKAPAG